MEQIADMILDFRYLNLLKSWFRGLLDKESFDDEARKLLLREQFRLHNHFLISLLSKCQTLSGSKSVAGGAAEKKKNKKRMRLSDANYDHRFRPVSPSEYLSPIQSAVPDAKEPAEAKYFDALHQMSLCSSDFALPDNFATHLRMFVNVWESGLDEMTDDAVLLLNLAIRDFMKNIITALISFKSTFRTQDRGRFKYNFAAPITDPLLVNSDTMHRFPVDSSKTFVEERSGEQLPELIPDKEVAEREAMFQLSCGTSSQWNMGPEVSRPLSLWHLFYAMKKYPHCVPSHSIYSVNLTRILNALSHDVDS